MGLRSRQSLPIMNTQGKVVILPPPCIAESLGIHLAHVTHANDANHGIFLGQHHLAMCAIARSSSLMG